MTKTRNITVSTQYDPSISGFGGYDEWTVWGVPNDENFAQALENFLGAYAHEHSLEMTWEGVE